jgi:hypothetical protein
MLPCSLLIVVTPALCLSRSLGRLSIADIRNSASSQCQIPNVFGHRRTYSSLTQQRVLPLLESTDDKMIDLVRLSAADLQSLQVDGSLTSSDLARLSLQQIEKYDMKGPELRAIIALVPEKFIFERTTFLDDERRAGRLLGPLHGIPIILKVCLSKYHVSLLWAGDNNSYRTSSIPHLSGESSLPKGRGR